MRQAIVTEAHHTGVTLVYSCPDDTAAIQFSTSSGTDQQQGRLWTEAADVTNYEALCRAVKRDARYDREIGLWVKRTSQDAFTAYKAAKKKQLEDLVEKNRKYAVELLGCRIKDEG